MAISYCTVPLYDTLGTEAVKHILNQTKQPIVVCSKDKIQGLIELKSSLPHLKVIVSMDDFEDSLKAKATEVGRKSNLFF